MGIGPGIEEETLELIACGGTIVKVADFAMLESTMDKIVSSVCSSKLTGFLSECEATI